MNWKFWKPKPVIYYATFVAKVGLTNHDRIMLINEGHTMKKFYDWIELQRKLIENTTGSKSITRTIKLIR